MLEKNMDKKIKKRSLMILEKFNVIKNFLILRNIEEIFDVNIFL